MCCNRAFPKLVSIEWQAYSLCAAGLISNVKITIELVSERTPIRQLCQTNKRWLLLGRLELVAGSLGRIINLLFGLDFVLLVFGLQGTSTHVLCTCVITTPVFMVTRMTLTQVPNQQLGAVSIPKGQRNDKGPTACRKCASLIV